MEYLLEIKALLLDLLNTVWLYAEPHMLEIVISLVIATFFLGFIASYK